MVEGEFDTAIKARRETIGVERFATGALTPPTIVITRALGNILIGSQSTSVSAVAGRGMSRNCLSDEVRVIKNPCLTGVGRWDDIYQVNRRPREASVSDQDGTHRHPQIIFDQLFSVENDHHVILTSKPSRDNVPIVERWEGGEVRMNAIIMALVSTGDETDREDALDILELRLMTNARDQVKVLRVDLSIDRVVRMSLATFCGARSYT